MANMGCKLQDDEECSGRLIEMKLEDILLGAVVALLFVFVSTLIRKRADIKQVIVQEDPRSEAARENLCASGTQDPWYRPWYPVNYWERPGERVAIYPNAWISPWAYGRYVGYG